MIYCTSCVQDLIIIMVIICYINNITESHRLSEEVPVALKTSFDGIGMKLDSTIRTRCIKALTSASTYVQVSIHIALK